MGLRSCCCLLPFCLKYGTSLLGIVELFTRNYLKKQIKKMSAFDSGATIYFCLEDLSDSSPQKLLKIFMCLDPSWLVLHGCKIKSFTDTYIHI